MTAEEFAAWEKSTGLGPTKAGELVRASRHEVWRWRKGKQDVPPRVALIIELRGLLKSP